MVTAFQVHLMVEEHRINIHNRRRKEQSGISEVQNQMKIQQLLDMDNHNSWIFEINVSKTLLLLLQ